MQGGLGLGNAGLDAHPAPTGAKRVDLAVELARTAGSVRGPRYAVASQQTVVQMTVISS